MGYKDHLTTKESNAKRQYRETKSLLATTFVSSPFALTENLTDSGIHIKAPTATQDFLQPLLMEIDNQVTNVATVIEVALDKITAGFHRIQLPDVAAVTINFLNCPINRVVDFFLDFTKENPANTPTVTFNQTVNGLNQSDLDNNTRILVPIAARDTQDEIRLDAYGLSSAGGGNFATRELDNLSVGLVAINTSLVSDTALQDRIGTNAIPWLSGHFGNVEFPTATGLTAAEVNIARISVPGNSMGLNVPTGFSFGFFVNAVQIGTINTTAIDFTAIPLTSFALVQMITGALFADIALDPANPGEMQRNAADVKVFSGGAVRNLSNIGAAGGANVNLSNLASPTAINQDLLFGIIGFDIGSTLVPVDNLFVNNVRLQTGVVTVNQPMITATAGDSMILNVPTGESFRFRENNVNIATLAGPSGGNATFTSDRLVADTFIRVNETGVDPIINGIFTLVGGRVKVFTNGILKDLTDIGTAAGGANTGLTNLIVTSINQSLLPDGDGTRSLGTAILKWNEGHFVELELQRTGTNKPAGGVHQITGDSDGLHLGADDSTDRISFFYAGVDTYRWLEDRLEFLPDGHEIRFNSASLELFSNIESDVINLVTGTGRTNPNVTVADLFTFFKNETSDATPYEILLRYSNPTTTGQPGIGNVGFEAEDSGNTFRSYAGMVTAIEDDSSGSRDGRMQLVVANGNNTGQSTTGTLTGIGVDIRGSSGTLQMGFFGATPVAQPNPAVNAAAIHAALVSLGIFV